MIVQAPDSKTIDFGDLPADQVKSAMQKLYPVKSADEKPPSTGMDVAKGVGSGLATDAAGLVAGPLDIGLQTIPAVKNAAEYLGTKAANAVTGKSTQPNYVSSPPSAIEGIVKGLGLDYEPKTTMGKVAKGATELAPIVGGLGVGAAKKIASSAGKLVTEDNASLLDTARKFGIPVFRSQVSDSNPTKMAGSLMKDIPFSGTEGKISGQVDAFNNAVMGTMGGKGSVTPENLGNAYDRISSTYKDLTGKYNIKVTPELDNKLMELAENAKIQLAGNPEKLKAFNEYWNLTIDNMKSGEIGGKSYQQIRSGIGNTLRSENTSPELGQLQNLIDDHFQANMPAEDAKRLQEARSQYRNMIAVEKVLKTGEKGHGISPAKLQGAVKQVFGDYAYGGQSDLEQLAQLGTILKDTFPQSGTAPRAAAMSLAKKIAGTVGAGGAGVAAGASLPATIAGLGGGMAAGRWGLTPYLYQNIAKNPQALAAIEKFVGPNASNGYGIGNVLKQVTPP